MSQRVRFFSASALLGALPLLALLAAATSGASLADTPAKSDAASNTRAPALRKLNPAPAHAYEIRLTLPNASELSSAADDKSPFTVVEGTAQFDASNAARCGRSNALAGNVPTLSSHEPFRLSRISATEYIGTVYADLLLDEDYYGRGVCHWQLTEARVAVRARTDSADTRFVAGLPAQKVLASDTQARYFWKGYYPNFEQRQHTDYGRNQLDAVPANRRGEFFVITLTSRKIASDVQCR
ncbi:hypothetical protein LN047_19455 [Achromobacter sp. JD417]|uniref:hypothetical protein n=1 Tax=Achromobacter sp. JD417 TaxID=2893881 RepID=UPI0035A6E2FA